MLGRDMGKSSKNPEGVNQPQPNKIQQQKATFSYSDLDEASEIRVEQAAVVVQPLVLENIDTNEASQMGTDDLIEHIRPLIGKILNDHSIQLNAKEQTFLEKRTADDMLGLGPLEYLLADENISDILVNSTKNIYIEKNGILHKSHIKFRSQEQIYNIISRIVSAIGRRVDETTPYVDARLADGSRVNAIIPPLAIDGPCISIRKFRKKTITLDNLIKNNTLSSTMADFLKIAVQCRKNIIIFGGTGTGKTTFLNALSQYIPSDERIVTIEDAAELQLLQDHIVRLETREANIEGRGAITERQLVKNALRMRPDRIILGEIRGEEAFELLQAMNTGHDGSLSTIHASSMEEVANRLVNMVLMAGFKLPAESIMNQIGNSVHILVEVNRLKDGSRKITKISEINKTQGLNLSYSDIFMYSQENNDDKAKFICCNNQPNLLHDAKFYGLEQELRKIL